MTHNTAESVRSQMYPMLIQIWKAFSKFNNLRFSPEMFCHISVIKDDCCVVAYGCFFLPEYLQNIFENHWPKWSNTRKNVSKCGA